jgi:hypothetical protein
MNLRHVGASTPQAVGDARFRDRDEAPLARALSCRRNAEVAQ